jgi:hypothetical protein
MLWLQAFLAVLLYVVLVGLSSDPRLGRVEEASSSPGAHGMLPHWPEPPVAD